ncbi:MAG: sigma-70 family RNA polymerase sigma factor [Acidobacteriia bacterium]|nr:sigma-70 family RNA polymerase sigma factor [Terriglobia bacterium]
MDAESSHELLTRVRAGDSVALEQLLARHLPRLRRWASGRLPKWARDREDTDDLVQETVIQTLRKVETFEPRHEGALQAYLRQALVNRIRDAVRRAQRRPSAVPIDTNMEGDETSPLEQAIGRESLDRYDAALASLRDEDREAIVARIELGLTYEEMAVTLGKPSGEAARVAVRRALLRLAEVMRDGR